MAPISSKPLKVLTAPDNALKLAPVSLPFHDVHLPYCTQYDLLGWFLSVVGRAPGDANVDNYFRPALFLYARWCAEMAGDRSVSPFMAQITWLDRRGAAQPVLVAPHLPDGADDADGGADDGDDDGGDGGDEQQPGAEQLRMALGASIGATRIMKSTVRLMRYHLLKEAAPGLPADDVSLVRRGAQRLGHCAETYPLLLLLG